MPPPPPLTDDGVLERERTFLRKQGLMLSVSSLGDEYLAAVTYLPTGRRVPIYARGSSAGAAAAAATARFRLESGDE